VTLLNDGPSNGGAEALRVACRFWPADLKRRVELDRMISAAAVTPAVKTARAEAGRTGGLRTAGKPKPRQGWVCGNCGARNRLFNVCVDCRAVKGT
jgi:hypothetical protein